MSVRPIVISGDPVLHQPAAPVTSFDDSLAQLIKDMFETMDEAPGVGLAAPQIGVGLRVFVYDYPDGDGTARRGVAVNPELFITPLEIRETTEADDEGCLSFPGERFPLVRADRCILRALDANGLPFQLECEGWFARIMQHEFDHLLGYLYVDRLEFAYEKEASKVGKKRGWGSRERLKPGISWMPGVDNLED
jgi:peptide deformylase